MAEEHPPQNDQHHSPESRAYDQPADPSGAMAATPPEQQGFPLEEVMKAQSTLRSAARMPPERYPLPQIIGMLSDEIDALRQRGSTDEEIAAIITGNSLLCVDAEMLRRFYATPQQRGKAPM